MYTKQLPIFKELNPYRGEIDENNRWIKLAELVPWEEVEAIYQAAFDRTKQKVIKPCRLILGLMVGQMMLKMSDRAILEHFHENVYFQYFCGQDSFVAKIDKKTVCHHTLLSKRRRRLGTIFMAEFQAKVLLVLKTGGLIKGEKLMLDTTVFPENITYPNDVKLLNTCREWCCEMILRVKNRLDPSLKVRTYRRVAKRVYRNYCKKKRKQQLFIHKTTKQMLRFLNRNIGQLSALLSQLELNKPEITHIKQSSISKLEDRLEVAKLIVSQQTQRVTTRGRHIQDRIVSFHKAQIRPIIRGKDGKQVEFGPKAHVALLQASCLS